MILTSHGALAHRRSAKPDLEKAGAHTTLRGDVGTRKKHTCIECGRQEKTASEVLGRKKQQVKYETART